jgi:hypothetical protein
MATYLIEASRAQAIDTLLYGKPVAWHHPTKRISVKTYRLGMPDLWPQQDAQGLAKFYVIARKNGQTIYENSFTGLPFDAAKVAMNRFDYLINPLSGVL